MTHRILLNVPTLEQNEAQTLVRESVEAFNTWKFTTWSERADLLTRLAHILLSKAEKWAGIMTIEMGKRHDEALAEVKKCADLCLYYAKNGENFLHHRTVHTENEEGMVHYSPLGPILLIMPWNFPFWQAFRCAIPTLCAGNAVLLKHASNVPQCAASIEDVFAEAGWPKNVFRNGYFSRDQLTSMLKGRQIRGVSLTGSTEAGRSVYASAAQGIKPVVLELGGSDPYIILEDANIQLAAQKCAEGRMLNAGQSCIGAKRMIVHEKVYESFFSQFVMELSKYEMGPPQLENTTLAPLAGIDHQQHLHQQVTRAIKNGAKLEMGGYVPALEGAFYPPTILTQINKKNPAWQEEFFGPVALVFKAKNAKEALDIANDVPFGLGAALFSQNLPRARQWAIDHLDTGNVYINDFVKSNAHFPFGGTKESGIGRELAKEGMLSFVNTKSIVWRRDT